VSRLRRARAGGNGSGLRILFPFTGSTVSRTALELTFDLAKARDATLVPAYLAVVPHQLSLEGALPARQCEEAVPLLELIEQRATKEGVRVDSRIEGGRTARHALSLLMDRERFDTLAVAAKTSASEGFEAADVAWLLESSPVEVLVLRPGAKDSA
jgi:hypothetical protein